MSRFYTPKRRQKNFGFQGVQKWDIRVKRVNVTLRLSRLHNYCCTEEFHKLNLAVVTAIYDR